MDQAERKRLREKFKKMCEDAGYPEGDKPHPWNIDVSKPALEAVIQHLADNNELAEDEDML